MQDSNVSQAIVTDIGTGNEITQPQPTQEQESGKKATGMELFIKNISAGPVKTQDQGKVETSPVEVKQEPVIATEEDEKSPMGGDESTPKFKKWEEMTQPELIERAKKFQSMSDKTKSEYDKLQKAIAERDNILQTIYKDPINAFKQIAPELSDVLDVQQPIPASVARWQENVLKPELKKMFPNVVDDDWQPDQSEIFIPGSPTSEFLRLSNNKQQELEARQQMSIQQRSQTDEMNQRMEQTVIHNNLEDKRYMMETFGFDNEQMMEYAHRFDQMAAQADPNDPYPETHPFRVRNLMKAIFFDELSDIKVQRAVADATTRLHQEYRSKGITLPQKQMPVDVTNIKTQSIQQNQPRSLPSNGTVMNKFMNQITRQTNRS